MRDLVLWSLVLDRQLASIIFPDKLATNINSQLSSFCYMYWKKGSSPARIDALPLCTLAQLLERRGADVGQVVGARARDDAVPDNGAVGRVGITRLGPLRRHVDEQLLRVPGEERR